MCFYLAFPILKRQQGELDIRLHKREEREKKGGKRKVIRSGKEKEGLGGRMKEDIFGSESRIVHIQRDREKVDLNGAVCVEADRSR